MVIRVGHLFRLCELNLSLVSHGGMVGCSISPPKTNSNVMLSTPDTASKIGNIMFTGALQHRREPSGDATLANLVAAAGHVPRSTVPAEGEREILLS